MVPNWTRSKHESPHVAMFRFWDPWQGEGVSISPLLTHCSGCESTLIQIECLHTLGYETTLMARRCPECGHGEELELASEVADVLCHHAAELAASLSELADRLEAADGLWISDRK